jgi:uncharacterized coiled-coil DUF342 family protein
VGSRKPAPVPAGSVVAQATEATRALREAMADAKRQTRECVAELEGAAQKAATELNAALREADELRRGFRGIVSSRMESLVRAMEPGWTATIKAELERGLQAAHQALTNHLELSVLSLEAAQKSFEEKEEKVNQLVQWLDETLRQMVTSDLFPHMAASAIKPVQVIIRSDKTRKAP